VGSEQCLLSVLYLSNYEVCQVNSFLVNLAVFSSSIAGSGQISCFRLVPGMKMKLSYAENTERFSSVGKW
jgi:hypothetical protein